MKRSLTHQLNTAIKILPLVVILLASTSIFAQKINKDERLANAYYKKLQFAKAIPYYQNAWYSDKKKSVARKIILCYNGLSDYRSSLRWFKKLKKGRSLNSNDQLLYLDVLHHLGSYEEIQQITSDYPDNTDEKIQFYKVSADSSLKWLEKRLYSVENCHDINTKFSENSPVLYQEGLVFSSNREGLLQKKKYGLDNRAFLDLYYASGSKTDFKNPVSFSSKINSNGHEGAICFNSDYSQAYFTRSENTQKENNQKSNRNRLKLYLSERSALGWSKPLRFAFNDSTFSFSHPFLSSDDQYFFFSSDISGGYGGSDIYYCKKLSNGKWSKPKNLGPSINSAGNEMYPVFDVETQVLTFSSDGLIGMGGFDLYTSKLISEEWTISENLKSPINSSFNDISISWLNFKRNGYICSNRPKGEGDYDIYFIQKK